MPNRLAGETSPYLLQHADNPVDWYPWGEEALDRARRENKPILLSIGYSACHWCHVMAHESFENPHIAQLMNDHFINIKVDREERPDLDSIYMEAVQAMTGGGGWPLTVFLTPEGKPFFGGTYFPPQDRYGMPGFPNILTVIADAYYNRRDDINITVKQLEEALSTTKQVSTSEEPLKENILAQAYSLLTHNFDEENGGFGSAPKFPQPRMLEFLLRYYLRSKDSKALEMVEQTLDRMAEGGIYDQIGGGFHRYSTDAHWLVPHFEKMLYDNALLSQLYLDAYQATGKPLYRSIAESTLDYVLREMTGPDGEFYSTQDADSEGIEGKYYVWTPQEITEAIGEKQSNLIKDYFDVTGSGNFEGKNILHLTKEIPQELIPAIEQAKHALLERRDQRTKPGRDEKILASWNGLLLVSMAEAACALEKSNYLDAAVANGTFLLNNMMVDGYLQHTYKDSKAKIDGYLQDYAMVIEGFLALHQATFKGKWLKEALRLTHSMIELFWDKSAGKFYDTGKRHEELFIRPANIFDEAVPSGPSSATMALLKLAALTDNEHYRRISITSLRSMAGLMSRQAPGFSNWLCALDFSLTPTREIAIIGPRDHLEMVKLRHTLYTKWIPNKIVAALDPDDDSRYSDLKLFEQRTMINGQPTVYVCEGYTCKAPATDADTLNALLQE